MSKAEKIGAVILCLWVLFYLIVFGWLIYSMPNYGTGVLH